MKKGTSTTAVLALFMVLALFAGPARAYEIKWGTAPAGGLWQVLGSVMLEDVLKRNPAIKGSTVPVGGAANVIGVTENKLNVGFSFSDVAHDAWQGKESFQAKGQIRNIRALAALFPEPTQFAVFADSGITQIAQLKGKKITPGPKGSAVQVVTRRILELYGITYKDVQAQMVSFGEGAQLMIDNHIDAILYGAMVLPTPGLVNVNSQRQIRLLPLSDKVIDKLVKTYKGLEPFTIPANTYKGVDYPVKGIASLCIAIVREDMPEDIAYSITKSIAENFGRYQTTVKPMSMAKAEDMPKEAGIPFHPGALKYYKEKGWVK
ncbi:MAG: TAXI family TRAP transporter solute-binding subunit [Deltaproteobacteria bacterium]|nr:TAXI family TRAP transporter solute-binding subunit [Deltaproteobacteria bacterium]